MYVLIHGPLDNFSCFRYENYLQDLKKSIKSIKYLLQDIFNRIIEKQNLSDRLPSNLFTQYPVLRNEVMLFVPSPFFKINDNLFKKLIITLSYTFYNKYS